MALLTPIYCTRQLGRKAPDCYRRPACARGFPCILPVPASALGIPQRQELCGHIAAITTIAPANAASRRYCKFPSGGTLVCVHRLGQSCARCGLTLSFSQSHFTPYSHPSQLTTNTVSNAERRDDDVDKRESKPQTPADLRVDAFREGLNWSHCIGTLTLTLIPLATADAMESLRQISKDADVKPRVKTEPGSAAAEVKSKPIKREEPVYGPSKSFRTAVQELGQARTMAHEQRSQTDDTLSSSGQAKDVKPKKEDLPSGPSEAFQAAFRDHRNGQGAIVELKGTTNIGTLKNTVICQCHV